MGEIMSRSFVQDPGEEKFNALTHALGAGLAIVALVMMILKALEAQDIWSVVSGTLFGSTMILLYMASTLYHAVASPNVKRICQIVDHASIYLLIAGTYTPFTLVTLRGGWGWSIFGVVWAAAVAGISVQIAFPGRFRTLMTMLYVAMGWIVVIALKPLIDTMPLPGLAWLGIGGFFYTAGVAFYIRKWFRFSHGIWHLFVLGGSISHFISIYYYVIP